VNSLYQGLERIKEEIRVLVANPPSDPLDLFVQVMEPFVATVQPSIDALKASGQALDMELRDLLSYFAEGSEASSEASKPEDFFNLVLSFSATLQVCAYWP
jgi:diaphanous 1